MKARKWSPSETLWWMQDPHSTIYGHGTFMTPETLACLLAEEAHPDQSSLFSALSTRNSGVPPDGTKTPSVSNYLSWFLSEAKYETSIFPPRTGEEQVHSHKSVRSSSQKKDDVTKFYESLNLFLESLPFEWFVIPSSVAPTHDPTSPAVSSGAFPQQKSPRSKTLIRLHFPATVPLDAIKITEPVELPGCNGLLFPDVKQTGHQYSCSIEDVQRQIQDSMAWLTSGYLEVKLREESEKVIRHRIKMLERAAQGSEESEELSDGTAEKREKRRKEVVALDSSPHNQDVADSSANFDERNDKTCSDDGERGSIKKDRNWNSGDKRCDSQKSPEEAVLCFRKNVCPGVVVGPPIGGELLFDGRTVEKMERNQQDDMSIDEVKKERIAKQENNFEQNSATLSSWNDFVKVYFSSVNKDSNSGSVTGQSDSDFACPVVKRPKYLSVNSVCNELSALMSRRVLSGNVALLTATIYGIPYGFIVSGANIRARDRCVLNWKPSSDFDLSPPSSPNSHRRTNQHAPGTPIPLPLEWNIPRHLGVKKRLIELSFASRCRLSCSLKSMERNAQALLLLAKTTISCAIRSGQISAPSSCILSLRDSDSLLPVDFTSFKSLVSFISKHQLLFNHSPMLLAASRVVVQICNILGFCYDDDYQLDYLQSSSTTQQPSDFFPSVEHFPSDSAPSVMFNLLLPTFLQHFVFAVEQFASVLPTTEKDVKAFLYSDSSFLLYSVLPFDHDNEEDNEESESHVTTHMKRVQKVWKKASGKQMVRHFWCQYRCSVPSTMFFSSRNQACPYQPRESTRDVTQISAVCRNAGNCPQETRIKNYAQPLTSDVAYRYYNLECRTSNLAPKQSRGSFSRSSRSEHSHGKSARRTPESSAKGYHSKKSRRDNQHDKVHNSRHHDKKNSHRESRNRLDRKAAKRDSWDQEDWNRGARDEHPRKPDKWEQFYQRLEEAESEKEETKEKEKETRGRHASEQVRHDNRESGQRSLERRNHSGRKFDKTHQTTGSTDARRHNHHSRHNKRQHHVPLQSETSSVEDKRKRRIYSHRSSGDETSDTPGYKRESHRHGTKEKDNRQEKDNRGAHRGGQARRYESNHSSSSSETELFDPNGKQQSPTPGKSRPNVFKDSKRQEKPNASQVTKTQSRKDKEVDSGEAKTSESVDKNKEFKKWEHWGDEAKENDIEWKSSWSAQDAAKPWNTEFDSEWTNAKARTTNGSPPTSPSKWDWKRETIMSPIGEEGAIKFVQNTLQEYLPKKPWGTLPNPASDEVLYESPAGETESESSNTEGQNGDKPNEMGDEVELPTFELQIMKLQRWACKEFSLTKTEVTNTGLPALLEKRKPGVNLRGYVVVRVDRDPQMASCAPEKLSVVASGQPVMMRGPGNIKRGNFESSEPSPLVSPINGRKPIRDAILVGLKNFVTRDDSFKYGGWRTVKSMLKGGGLKLHGPSLNKGSEDALELDPVLNLGGEFSVDVWIKLPAADDSWLGQRIKDDHVTVLTPIMTHNGGSYTPNLTFKHRGWHRLIFTHSIESASRHYYLDGFFIGTAQLPPNKSDTQLKYIGCLNSGKSGSRQTFGAFARLRVFNSVLSTSEIAELYGVSAINDHPMSTIKSGAGPLRFVEAKNPVMQLNFLE